MTRTPQETLPAAGRTRQAVRVAAALAAAVLAVGCAKGHPDTPRPTSITPSSGSQAVPVPVRIRGEGFGADVSTDLSGGGGVVDARFQALLGDTALIDVALLQDGTIAATVPVGMPVGTYDLTVIGPDGRAGTLAQAYRVVASGTVVATVAAFRVDPVGAQVAYQPFTVVVTAVDGAGAVVPDYAGSVVVTDLTGTVVPGRVGLFSAGRWSGSIEIRAASAADVLTVTDGSGATGHSGAFAVAPAPAAGVRFDGAGSSTAAGQCTGPVPLSLVDAFGQPTAVILDTTLSLAATPAAGFTLYSDGACATPLAAPVVPAGQGTVSVWFAATGAGSLQLTASMGPLPPDAQTWTVDPGSPSRLVFLTTPQSVTAGECSGVATLEVRDAWGNPSAISTTAATSIALAGTDLGFSGGSGCGGGPASFASGATTATFSFRRTVAGLGTVVVTATAGGLSESQTETIVVAPATQLVFTSAPQTVEAGECSGDVTLETRDLYGNPSAISTTAATSIALTGTDLGFSGGSGCGGGPASFATGATTATFSFRRTVAGLGTVVVTATAAGLSQSQTENIDPGAPAAVVFPSPPVTAPVNGCSPAVDLAVLDAFGNASPVATPLAVTVAAAPATGFGLFSDAACTIPVAAATVPAGSDAATFHFSSSQVGPLVLTVSAGTLTGASQTETVIAAVADHLAFVTAPQMVQAGACSGPVTIEAQDAWGNPVVVSSTAATTVVLSGTDLVFHAGTGCTGGAVEFAAGATQTTFSFRRAVAGIGAVPVTVTAGTLTGSQTETIVGAPATQLVFTSAPQTVQASQCSGDVTLETRDLYGNPSAISTTAATSIALTGTDLGFSGGSGCGGGPASFASGAATATFSFRRTVAGLGTVVVTATAAGLSQSQTETIVAGAADHFAWATIGTPQGVGNPFAVSVSARDLYGNLASYTGTATLSASSGTVSCVTSCTSASVTAAFASGQWSGTVAVPAAVTGLTLTATAPGLVGVSNSFDVGDEPAPRSPPFATFTATPRLIVSGNSVTFDASASSDRQTPAASLQVSWDFEAAGYAQYVSTVLPPASPWTSPWTTTKTANHSYINNGTTALVFRPRLAVRDTETAPGGPDVGYASGMVVVLPNGNDLCIVNTSSLVDDGATGCYGPGLDGRLSLTEAVRLANVRPTPLNIAFDAPRTITSATGTTLTLTRTTRIVGMAGVILDGVSLDIAAEDVLVAGLEFRNLWAPITVRSQTTSDARLEDLVVHDGEGILVQGHALLRNVQMYGCAGWCVRENGAGAYLAVFGSDFRGSGDDIGLAFDACAVATPMNTSSSPYRSWTAGGWSTSGAAAVVASVFTGFDTAVTVGASTSCRNPFITNVTFDGNGTGVRRDSSVGSGGYLLDSVFSRNTVAAVDAAACAFTLEVRNAAWNNVSAGCLAPDITADPLYVWMSARDFRIQYASPLKDTANAGNNVEVDDAGPGLYLGAAPDRGGRETY